MIINRMSNADRWDHSGYNELLKEDNSFSKQGSSKKAYFSKYKEGSNVNDKALGTEYSDHQNYRKNPSKKYSNTNYTKYQSEPWTEKAQQPGIQETTAGSSGNLANMVGQHKGKPKKKRKGEDYYPGTGQALEESGERARSPGFHTKNSQGEPNEGAFDENNETRGNYTFRKKSGKTIHNGSNLQGTTSEPQINTSSTNYGSLQRENSGISNSGGVTHLMKPKKMMSGQNQIMKQGQGNMERGEGEMNQAGMSQGGIERGGINRGVGGIDRGMIARMNQGNFNQGIEQNYSGTANSQINIQPPNANMSTNMNFNFYDNKGGMGGYPQNFNSMMSNPQFNQNYPNHPMNFNYKMRENNTQQMQGMNIGMSPNMNLMTNQNPMNSNPYSNANPYSNINNQYPSSNSLNSNPYNINPYSNCSSLSSGFLTGTNVSAPQGPHGMIQQSMSMNQAHSPNHSANSTIVVENEEAAESEKKILQQSTMLDHGNIKYQKNFKTVIDTIKSNNLQALSNKINSMKSSNTSTSIPANPIGPNDTTSQTNENIPNISISITDENGNINLDRTMNSNMNMNNPTVNLNTSGTPTRGLNTSSSPNSVPNIPFNSNMNLGFNSQVPYSPKTAEMFMGGGGNLNKIPSGFGFNSPMRNDQMMFPHFQGNRMGNMSNMGGMNMNSGYYGMMNMNPMMMDQSQMGNYNSQFAGYNNFNNMNMMGHQPMKNYNTNPQSNEMIRYSSMTTQMGDDSYGLDARNNIGNKKMNNSGSNSNTQKFTRSPHGTPSSIPNNIPGGNSGGFNISLNPNAPNFYKNSNIQMHPGNKQHIYAQGGVKSPHSNQNATNQMGFKSSMNPMNQVNSSLMQSNNQNFHGKGYPKKFNNPAFRIVKSDKNVVGNLHGNNYKTDLSGMNDQFRMPNMNKVWRNSNPEWMNMNYRNMNPHKYGQQGQMMPGSGKYNPAMQNNNFKKFRTNSRKGFAIKEDHNDNIPTKEEENDYLDSSDDQMEYGERNKEKVSLIVTIKLLEKEEKIIIAHNEDILQIAKDLVHRNHMNENLIKPIQLKIKQALNKAETIFEQSISKRDMHNLAEMQNYWKECRMANEQSSGNDLIETCDENLHDLSCITNFGCSDEILDQISPSLDELKLCERLNISS